MEKNSFFGKVLRQRKSGENSELMWERLSISADVSNAARAMRRRLRSGWLVPCVLACVGGAQLQSNRLTRNAFRAELHNARVSIQF